MAVAPEICTALWSDLLAAKQRRALVVSLEQTAICQSDQRARDLSQRGLQILKESLVERRHVAGNHKSWGNLRRITSDDCLSRAYRLLQLDQLLEPPGPHEPALNVPEQGFVVAAIAGELDKRLEEASAPSAGAHREQATLDRLCALLAALDSGPAQLQGPPPSAAALGKGESARRCASCGDALRLTRGTPPECALGVRCDVCGDPDLGRTCPYFYYCVRCRYACCPGCDGVSVDGEPDLVCVVPVGNAGRRWRCDKRHFICGGLYPDHSHAACSGHAPVFERVPSVIAEAAGAVPNGHLANAMLQGDAAQAERCVADLHTEDEMDELRKAIFVAAAASESDSAPRVALTAVLTAACRPGFGREYARTQAVASAIIAAGAKLPCTLKERRDILGCPDLTQGMRNRIDQLLMPAGDANTP